MVRKAVRCHPGNRFFTPFHRPISRFSHTVFLPPFRMTIGGKGVIMRRALIVIRSKCEESITVVRKTVRRHQRHRFFTPCHCSVSRFSLKAFSTPFRMTLEGKSVIIKGTLSVIQSNSEESIAVIRKTISVIRKMVGLDEICPQQQKKKHDLPGQSNLWENW